MGRLDSELSTHSPDYATVFQLKRSLERKIDTLDVELLEDEVALADEIEQADHFKVPSIQPLSRLRKIPS